MSLLDPSTSICFSLGKNRFDNTPKQKSVENFDSFEDAITAHRSQRKGELYFCAGMCAGEHPDSARYPVIANYRLGKR